MGILLDTLGLRGSRPPQTQPNQSQRRVELPDELVDPTVLAEANRPKPASFLDALLARSDSGGRQVDFNGGFGEILGDAARGLITGGLTGRRPTPVAEEVAQRRALRQQETLNANEAARRAKLRVLSGALAGGGTPKEASARLDAIRQAASAIDNQFDEQDRAILAQGGPQALFAALQDGGEATKQGGRGGGVSAVLQAVDRIKALREAAGRPLPPEEEALIVERFINAVKALEVGPGLVLQQDPTRGEITVFDGGGGGGGGGAQVQSPALRDGLGVSQDNAATPPQPQNLTEQVAGAEGKVAAAKQIAANDANQIAKVQESAREGSKLLTSFDQVQALLDAGVKTGPAEQATLPLRKFLANIGAVPSEDTNLTNQQALVTLNNTLSLQLRSPDSLLSGGLPGAASDNDLKFLKESVPGLLVTPEGNKLVVDLYRRRLGREIEKAAWMERQFNATGRLPPIDDQNAWAESQPSIVPDSLRRTINDLTEPQKQNSARLRAIFDSGFN